MAVVEVVPYVVMRGDVAPEVEFRGGVEDSPVHIADQPTQLQILGRVVSSRRMLEKESMTSTTMTGR